MSEAQELFLVVVLLYAVECSHVVDRGASVFARLAGGRWARRDQAGFFGNARIAFHLSWPVPPLGLLAVARPWPLSLAPEGVLAFIAAAPNPGERPPQDGRRLEWEQATRIEADGRALRVAGRRLAGTDSPLLAQELASLLGRIAALPVADRGAAIEEALASSFDAAAVRARHAALERASRPPLLLGNLLFAMVFLIAPLAAARFGLKLAWAPLLLAALGLWAAAVLSFRRRHRELYGEQRAHRRAQTLHLCLSPLSAMRAADALSRDLFTRFHPLAVGRVLLAEAEFRSLAAATLRDLDRPLEPLAPDASPASREIERWHRSRMLAQVERFLAAEGFDPGDLRAPPLPASPAVRALCPRCAAQFEREAETCPACALALEPLARS